MFVFILKTILSRTNGNFGSDFFFPNNKIELLKALVLWKIDYVPHKQLHISKKYSVFSVK